MNVQKGKSVDIFYKESSRYLKGSELVRIPSYCGLFLYGLVPPGTVLDSYVATCVLRRSRIGFRIIVHSGFRSLFEMALCVRR